MLTTKTPMSRIKDHYHDEICRLADEDDTLEPDVIEVEAREVPRFDPTTVTALKKWSPKYE